MATLAETPSHGRLPKNLNTKLVKLFPPRPVGVYYREASKLPGEKCTCLSIILAYFITVPTPSTLPSHSFVLLLSSVACSIPLGHWQHALESVWVGSMNSYSPYVHCCCHVVRFPCLLTCPLFKGVHPVAPQRSLFISASVCLVSCWWNIRVKAHTLLLSWCYWCEELYSACPC